MASSINLKNIRKRLEEFETNSVDDLKNPKLEKAKKQIEEKYSRLLKEKEDVKDIDIAEFNSEVSRFLDDVARERKLAKGRVTGVTVEESDVTDEKIEIPLFRVHNTVLTMEMNSRPVITYYRVNGNPGRLEESFKIVSGTNKSSVYGVGATYEEY